MVLQTPDSEEHKATAEVLKTTTVEAPGQTLCPDMAASQLPQADGGFNKDAGQLRKTCCFLQFEHAAHAACTRESLTHTAVH